MNNIAIGEKVYVADEWFNQVYEGVQTDEGVRLLRQHPFRGGYGASGHKCKTEKEAWEYLEDVMNEEKEEMAKEDPIQVLFNAWATEYPDGQPVTKREAMRKLIKEKYNVNV